MTAKVKICGITRADEAAATVRAGADYLGLNLWPRSKRYVPVAAAAALADAARAAGEIRIVGLFVDADLDTIAAADAAVGFDAIQLHGDEPPQACVAVIQRTGKPVWKAVAVGASGLDVTALGRWPVAALLLDAATPGRGGSGQTIDWGVAARAVRAASTQVVLAGGLDPDNVAAAIRTARPWAVDVASGVETAPGRKDPARVAAFVAAARAA